MTLSPIGGRQLWPLGKGGGAGAVYLLRDEFITAQAAPMASPHTCEPGPGILTYQYPAGWYISGGKLYIGSSGSTWNSMLTPYNPNVCGLCFVAQMMTAVGGWLGPNVSSVGYTLRSTTIAAVTETNFGNGAVAGTYRFVSRGNTGSIGNGVYFIRGNEILWIGGRNSYIYSTTRRFEFTIYLSGYNQIERLAIANLPAPWNTEWGIADNYSATVSAGATLTHQANGFVEISRVMLAGDLLELSFRTTDADNRWIVRLSQSTNTLKLIERNAGIETERASGSITVTAGKTFRVMAAFNGSTIAADALILDVAGGVSIGRITNSFNSSATGASTNLSGIHFASHARTISGATLAALEAI